MFSIVGSGFGLYGYLPALVEAFGDPVVLPESYRDKVAARAELRPYLASIRWAADAEAALSQATGAVIAMPPLLQAEAVSRCLRHPGIATLVLEKPLAVTPGAAIDLIGHVRESGRRLRVGYSLLDTAWARGLDMARIDGRASIEWSFMAHHFARGIDTWKRRHSQGGGVLRFFAIHLLAVLARQGYTRVRGSTLDGDEPDQPRRWSARFEGEGLPECRVDVDSRSALERFRIGIDAPRAKGVVELAEPFAAEAAAPHGGDRRVPVLVRLLASLAEPDAGFDRLYGQVNDLWRAAEEA